MYKRRGWFLEFSCSKYEIEDIKCGVLDGEEGEGGPIHTHDLELLDLEDEKVAFEKAKEIWEKLKADGVNKEPVEVVEDARLVYKSDRLFADGNTDEANEKHNELPPH